MAFVYLWQAGSFGLLGSRWHPFVFLLSFLVCDVYLVSLLLWLYYLLWAPVFALTWAQLSKHTSISSNSAFIHTNMLFPALYRYKQDILIRTSVRASKFWSAVREDLFAQIRIMHFGDIRMAPIKKGTAISMITDHQVTLTERLLLDSSYQGCKAWCFTKVFRVISSYHRQSSMIQEVGNNNPLNNYIPWVWLPPFRASRSFKIWVGTNNEDHHEHYISHSM